MYLTLALLLFWGWGSAWGAEGVHRVPSDFATIQQAIDAVADGGRILVAPGIYQESVRIGAKGVVLEASAVAYTRAMPARSDLAQTVINGGGADFVISIAPEGGEVTLRGFTIRNADDGIYPERPFTLSHCRVTETSDGIDFEGGGGLIEYCYFEGNRDDGIDLDGPVAAVIRHNQINDNKDDGIEIRLHPFEGDSIHTTISDNTIARNGEDGIQFIDYEAPTSRSFRIARNLILDNAMVGIALMGNATTRENYEGDIVEERIDVVHNTIAGNPYGITGGGNLLIVNTIIAYAAKLGLKNAAPPARVSHILLFENGRDAENTPLDKSVIVGVDPLFADGYLLQAASPAINRGMPLGEPYSGDAPDIGAREFETAPDRR